MEIRIVARHFDLTPALNRSVQEKVERLLKHCSGIIDCTVILYKTNTKAEQNLVEINVNLRNKTFCVKTQGEYMYSTIDDAIKKIQRQLLNHKAIIKNHHHTSAKYYEYNNTIKQMVAQSNNMEQFS
jgi:putative sigma-54 modulation protein